MFYKYSLLLGDDKIPYLEKEEEYIPQTFRDPSSVDAFARSEQMHKMAEEHVFVIAMNVKSDAAALFEISHGTSCTSVCGIREIFMRLLMCGACGFILVHNHPSGDPEPSTDDCAVVKRLKGAGKTMGVKFLDSVIVGKEDYYSFNEHGRM